MHSPIGSGQNQGLLSLAFPPGPGAKPHFYVNYTGRLAAGATVSTVVSRFQVTGDPNLADSSSEHVVLTVAQPTSRHNGGQIAFGPDGYLYIGMGDGGVWRDADNEAQNPASLLGKLLRILLRGFYERSHLGHGA
jgi:glucose/arabinose dehydrogenase